MKMRKPAASSPHLCTLNVRDAAMFLTELDLSSINNLDPSLSEGHQLVYDHEFPMELRMQDTEYGPQEVGTLEAIRCKILLLDEFFNTCSVDPMLFNGMRQKQKLFIDFQDYPNVLMRMFTSCIKEPHSFLAVFVMTRSGSSRLDFIQNLEYKFVELLSIDFCESPKNVLREQVAFRYNAVKSRLALVQARLQDVNTLIKTKNPSLLLHIQKSLGMTTPSSAGRSYFYDHP